MAGVRYAAAGMRVAWGSRFTHMCDTHSLWYQTFKYFWMSTEGARIRPLQWRCVQIVRGSGRTCPALMHACMHAHACTAGVSPPVLFPGGCAILGQPSSTWGGAPRTALDMRGMAEQARR